MPVEISTLTLGSSALARRFALGEGITLSQLCCGRKAFVNPLRPVCNREIYSGELEFNLYMLPFF